MAGFENCFHQRVIAGEFSRCDSTSLTLTEVFNAPSTTVVCRPFFLVKLNSNGIDPEADKHPSGRAQGSAQGWFETRVCGCAFNQFPMRCDEIT